MLAKQLCLIGFLLLGAAQAQTTSTSTTTASTPSATAQELLSRVTGGGRQSNVLLGSAPADLRGILPPGSRVIGTVTYAVSSGSVPSVSTVYLDTSLAPGKVVAHFVQALGPTWKQSSGTLTPYEAQGGFQPNTLTSNVTFYRASPPEILRVEVQAVGNVTQVNLNQQTGQDAERFIAYLVNALGRPPGLMLPKLSAPEGSTVTPASSGSGDDSVTQSARIETKLSRQAVMTHYAAQLRQAGWTLANQADVPAAASTIWSFKQDGRDRLGILTIAGTSPFVATLISQGTR